MDQKPGVLGALTSPEDVETTMAASPRQESPDDKLADVRGQMAALYAAHALAIADALSDKPLCVVTGPRRFGKTTSLLPALAGILRARGKTAHIINGRDYEEESFTLYLAAIWQEAESAISGQMARVVRLPQMIVSPRVARDFLTLYSPVRNEAARTQMVACTVERVRLSNAERSLNTSRQ